jgi:Domain of unknown function (DUF3291)
MRSPITYHLAHLNLAIAREALDHPRMADFVAQLGPVNELARASRGFVWTPEAEEAGSATAVFGSERALPNLSVWASLDDLHQFVYQGLHGLVLDRRSEWFEKPLSPAYVLWWVPAGHRPDLAEAKQRLEHLAVHGPTPYAFTFTESFAAPEVKRL